MLVKQAYEQLLLQLKKIYDNREAANIADWVIENITAQKKVDRLINKNQALSLLQENTLENITQQLLQYKPVQYVLNESWFAGMQFYVDENVLIPRPETEELVEWIVQETKQATTNIKHILDIGTGSGCIAIALKKKLSLVEITAIDVSNDALKIAAKNASKKNVAINFFALNFLDETVWDQLPMFNIIVSNPPYIAAHEITAMDSNVTSYEPHLALFVADEDPLLFYRKIALFAKTHLLEFGKIFVEMNEALGYETMNLFKQHGFECELKKDLQGKDRMLKAWMK